MEVVQIKSKFLRNIFDQNTYVLRRGDEAIVIDAGAEVEEIKNALQGAKLLAVLMTHLHFDHLWNIESILKEFDCDVFMLDGAEEKLASPEHNVSVILNRKMTFKVDPKKIKHYSKVNHIGGFEVEVIKTPGHSSDSVCLLIEKSLFSGDTIFSGAIGRTDLYDGSLSEIKNSLETIAKLDFDKVYPGHYESTTKQKVLNDLKTMF